MTGGVIVAAALDAEHRRQRAAAATTVTQIDDVDGSFASALRRWTSGAFAAAAACVADAIKIPPSLLRLFALTSSAAPGGERDRPPPPCMPGVLHAIGNTPMIRVKSLSDATGCDILIKCEFANPGGSVKDRVALRIIQEALASGDLRPGGIITEGTAGSTGVSLAMVAGALGCRAYLALPDDAALEKSQMMAAYGAEVERVRPVSITNRGHFVNVARRKAETETATNGPGAGFFANQFENLANFRAHVEGTAPEIWAQCGGRVDTFVCAAGTGGTLAGIATYLKERDPTVGCYLVDPPGSSLYNKVTRGVMYTREEAEGKRLRNPFDTITEGVGINRLTANFSIAVGDGGAGLKEGPSLLSGAYKASDREAVEMSRYLAREDGLFLGSSSCVNLVGAVKVARALGPGRRVVTIACDSGVRHLTKFWSPEYVAKHGLAPEATGLEFLGQ